MLWLVFLTLTSFSQQESASMFWFVLPISISFFLWILTASEDYWTTKWHSSISIWILLSFTNNWTNFQFWTSWNSSSWNEDLTEQESSKEVENGFRVLDILRNKSLTSYQTLKGYFVNKNVENFQHIVSFIRVQAAKTSTWRQRLRAMIRHIYTRYIKSKL